MTKNLRLRSLRIIYSLKNLYFIGTSLKFGQKKGEKQ